MALAAIIKGSLKDAAVWFYWNPFRRLIQGIGFRAAYRVGGCLGWILGQLSAGKRAAMERELALIPGQPASPEGRREIVLEAFKIRLRNEMDVLLFPVLNEKVVEEMIPIAGREHLDAALARGKGAMLLFAHFGANQMVMPAIGYRGYPMSQLSAPPTVWPEKMPHKRFSPMEKRGLETRWRHELSLPVEHVSVFGSLKPAFRRLKENGVLGIAADGGGGAKRVAVPMFGGEALFSTGAMEIAARTGCAVLPTFVIRDRRGVNTLHIEPALDLDSDGGDGGSATARNMALFASRLEHYVIRHPEHYLDFLALRRLMAGLGDPPFLTPGASSPPVPSHHTTA